jgi:phage terminase large subunit-like protein
MSNSYSASAAADAIETSWRALARPSQLPPDGDWSIWLVLAGRGFGKTRCGAESGSARKPRPPAWPVLPLWGPRPPTCATP